MFSQALFFLAGAGAAASALSDLANDPRERATRQRAADRALGVARRLSPADPAHDETLLTTAATGRMVAADVMAFAGVDPEQAVAAVREGTDRFDVATPAPSPRRPFGGLAPPTPASVRVPARVRRAARSMPKAAPLNRGGDRTSLPGPAERTLA